MEETGTAIGSIWLFAVVGGPIILGTLMWYGARRARRRKGQKPTD